MYEIVSEDGSRRTVRFSEPAETTDEHFRKVRREVSKDLDMPGFRPGKIPRSIVDRQYGNMIRAEVADRIRRDLTSRLIDEEDWILDDSDPEGKIDLPTEGTEYSFEMTFSLFETPEPTGIDSLEITVPLIDLEKATEDTIESFRARMISFEEVDRPSTLGDVVMLEAVPSGEEADPRELSVRLGEDSIGPGFDVFVEGVVPGHSFSARMEGPGGGEPSMGHDFKVVKVLGPVLPELDDEFAGKAAGVANMEELREKVRENVDENWARELEDMKERQAVDALLEANPFEPPAYMVDNLTADYLSRLDEEEPDQPTRDAARSIASRKVRQFLLLRALAMKEGLEVTTEEIEADRSPEESSASVLDRLRNRKALELVLERSTITEREPAAEAPKEDADPQEQTGNDAWGWVLVPPEDEQATPEGGEE